MAENTSSVSDTLRSNQWIWLIGAALGAAGAAVSGLGAVGMLMVAAMGGGMGYMAQLHEKTQQEKQQEVDASNKRAELAEKMVNKTSGQLDKARQKIEQVKTDADDTQKKLEKKIADEQDNTKEVRAKLTTKLTTTQQTNAELQASLLKTQEEKNDTTQQLTKTQATLQKTAQQLAALQSQDGHNNSEHKKLVETLRDKTDALPRFDRNAGIAMIDEGSLIPYGYRKQVDTVGALTFQQNIDIIKQENPGYHFVLHPERTAEGKYWMDVTDKATNETLTLNIYPDGKNYINAQRQYDGAYLYSFWNINHENKTSDFAKKNCRFARYN